MGFHCLQQFGDANSHEPSSFAANTGIEDKFEPPQRLAAQAGGPCYFLDMKFQLRRRILDEALKKLPLRALLFRQMPERFPKLVRLPEIPLVIEVDPEEVEFIFSPAVRRDIFRLFLLFAIRMPFRTPSRVGIQAGDKAVRWKGALRTKPRRIRPERPEFSQRQPPGGIRDGRRISAPPGRPIPNQQDARKVEMFFPIPPATKAPRFPGSSPQNTF